MVGWDDGDDDDDDDDDDVYLVVHMVANTAVTVAARHCVLYTAGIMAYYSNIKLVYRWLARWLRSTGWALGHKGRELVDEDGK